MKTYGPNLSLVFILTVALSTVSISIVALASCQSSSAQISELGSPPTAQSTANQSEGIIFQGDSVTVFTLGDPYRQDRWQAIDNYTAGEYNIEGVIQYKQTEDNSTLRSDRTFVILEKQ